MLACQSLTSPDGIYAGVSLCYKSKNACNSTPSNVIFLIKLQTLDSQAKNQKIVQITVLAET